MPLLTCTIRSVPRPFALVNGGTSTTAVRLVAPATITWSDGTVDPAWTPGPFFTVSAAGTGAATVDTTLFAWLIVAVKGRSAPVLVEEGQLGTVLDSLLGGTPSWAPLFRIIGTILESYPQQTGSAGSGLPAGTKGDLLYFDGTTWVVRHIGNPTDVLYVDPATHLPVWTPLSALASLISPLLPVGPGGIVGSGVAALFLGDTIEAPPAGWQQVSFVPDANWTPAVDVTARFVTDGGTPYPGSRTIWRNSPATTGETCAIRLSFVLSTNVSGAQLQLQEDDQIDGVWLNGAEIFAGGGPVRGQITMPPVTLTVAQLLPGALNVLAVQGKNIYPPDAFLNFALSVF